MVILCRGHVLLKIVEQSVVGDEVNEHGPKGALLGGPDEVVICSYSPCLTVGPNCGYGGNWYGPDDHGRPGTVPGFASRPS